MNKDFCESFQSFVMIGVVVMVKDSWLERTKEYDTILLLWWGRVFSICSFRYVLYFKLCVCICVFFFSVVRTVYILSNEFTR